MLILVDIDGTIANIEHRRHFLEETPKNWDAFYDACDQDPIIPEMQNLIICLAMGPFKHQSIRNTLVYITGSTERVRDKRSVWLMEGGFPPGRLLCRADGDFRPDYVVKKEIYEQQVIPVSGHAMLAIEDREQVVKMWRSLGIVTLQCAEGKY